MTSNNNNMLWIYKYLIEISDITYFTKILIKYRSREHLPKTRALTPQRVFLWGLFIQRFIYFKILSTHAPPLIMPTFGTMLTVHGAICYQLKNPSPEAIQTTVWERSGKESGKQWLLIRGLCFWEQLLMHHVGCDFNLKPTNTNFLLVDLEVLHK